MGITGNLLNTMNKMFIGKKFMAGFKKSFQYGHNDFQGMTWKTKNIFWGRFDKN